MKVSLLGDKRTPGAWKQFLCLNGVLYGVPLLAGGVDQMVDVLVWCIQLVAWSALLAFVVQVILIPHFFRMNPVIGRLAVISIVTCLLISFSPLGY